MDWLEIHPRVMQRHPNLSEADILEAWTHSYYERLRPESQNFPEYLWIGFDRHHREIEMVGTQTESGWLIYHANTPLSKRTRAEIERSRRL